MYRFIYLSLFITTFSVANNTATASHNEIHANQNGYFGLSGINISDDGFNISGGALISGLNLNQFFAIESLFGSLSDGSSTANGIETKNEIDYFSTIRVRLNFHRRKMIPYFYLGYTGMSMTAVRTTTNTGATTRTEGGEGGYSYGVGIDLFGNRNTAIFLSTGVLLKNENLNLTSSIIGFRYYLSRQRLMRFR